MIGPALNTRRRARATGFPETDVGMLDVSANALAVLILATMMILTVAAKPTPRGEVPGEQPPPLFYPSPLEVSVAPQSAYWFVTEGGLTRLDLDAFALVLSEGKPVARTAQGEITMIIDRRSFRDLNDHRAHVSPDWQALAAEARPFTAPDDLKALAAEIGAAFENDGIAPTFIVPASEAGRFAPLYWALREAQVPMRWSALDAGVNLTLSRQSSNFETRGRQWQ